MSKRVYEVAKEVSISSANLMQTLREIGHPVISASSSVPDPILRKLFDAIGRPYRAESSGPQPERRL